MEGDFFLLEHASGATKARRLPLGDTRGRNEAWLRDTLFANPEIIPIDDIEPAYGPLLPLCRELRTPAGPIDIAFINRAGRLTLVECKLWRNAEARRKVVAQILDYARTVKQWSYADLQRQVSIATGQAGNIPFEVVRRSAPDIEEHHLIDRTSRSIRDGRFLLLIAGDGIREDVGGIADLINRNATSGFSFGQVEVALYEFPDGALAVQPRAISRTHLIERHVIVADTGTVRDADEDSGSADTAPDVPGPNAAVRDAEREWWRPVTEMSFDDPEQDQPKYRWRGHVRAQLPLPGLWLVGYRSGDDRVGVFLSGNRDVLNDFMSRYGEVIDELPTGSVIEIGRNGAPYIACARPLEQFANEDEMRAWISTTLNDFANVLRPKLRALS